MKAYWWKAGDWIGFATGKDWGQLFWAVDFQVDPYECEYIPMNQFCGSWKIKNREHHEATEFEEFDDDEDIEMDIEWPVAPEMNDPRWKPIDWNSKPGTLYYEEEEA